MKISSKKTKEEVTFLILVDASDESASAVKIVSKLVKETGGKIALFYPIDGTNLITSENPLVAIRCIEEAQSKVELTLQSLEEMLKQEHVTVEKSHSFGSLKTQLRERLDAIPTTTLVLTKNNFEKVSRGWSPAIKDFKGDILILGENSTFLTVPEVQALYPNYIHLN